MWVVCLDIVSDQCLHFLSLSQQFLDIATGSKMDITLQDKYGGKVLLCPNILGKYMYMY